ncbi:protein phyllopod [Drosophila hydei]|uniref:Protein phyllopod n=1 Tax=Drosophila hydei TaxID=7224 RepID=A0A6J1LXH6_DROHY|nr:protein phyllopod [Drosophila hydei]
MSANNEAEPAAALAAAAASSSADAAAAASEYLKRTCLICGCQTNQTINIYEPRSGPNIVQLIQAKFKFQPLNEDKFLCFSCNNWLINWHSLQALNSNDAESQSRSQSPSGHMGNNSSSAGIVQQQLPLSKGQPVKLRPVAQVRPQPQPQRQPQPEPQLHPHPQPQPSSRLPALKNIERDRSVRRRQPALGRRRCRRTSKQPRRRSLRSSCESCKWRTLHKRSLAKVAQLQRQLSRQQQQQQLEQRLVKSPTYQRLPKPRVDGKVVAMFRRLGTTLSNEQTQEQEQEQEQRSTAPLNRIMSPAKRRPRWTRQLDEDEILLEFDGAIGEVLPSMQPITAKRRLSYQSKGEAEAETAAELKVEQELELKLELELAVSQVNHQAELQLEQLQLPQGLSITLI